ncbi:MAG TPA: hypothetical protein VM490_10485 [Armatimonadaceae bacterium]|nr:hypothetical protein [Armatimonadaceae bacterium]
MLRSPFPSRSRRPRRGSFVRAAGAALGLLLAATAAALTAPATPARADIKVVQETTVTGLEELERDLDKDLYGIPVTVVWYFKDDLFREDVAGKRVRLYDCKKDRYTVIDLDRRIYAVKTLAEAQAYEDSSFFSGVKIVGKATVEPGGTAKTLAGHGVKNHVFNSESQIQDQRSGVSLIAVRCEGEQWNASKLVIPAKCDRIARVALNSGPVRVRRLISALTDKLGAISGVPLTYEWVINIKTLGPVAGYLDATIEAHGKVKGVSTKPLPASLFQVPKGFRRAAPEQEYELFRL